MVRRKTGAVIFAFTKRRFDWILENCSIDRTYFGTSDRELPQPDAGWRQALAGNGRRRLRRRNGNGPGVEQILAGTG